MAAESTTFRELYEREKAENARLREALDECRDGIAAEHGWAAWAVNFPKAAKLDLELKRGTP